MCGKEKRLGMHKRKINVSCWIIRSLLVAVWDEFFEQIDHTFFRSLAG
jgi:hypothetical protein